MSIEMLVADLEIVSMSSRAEEETTSSQVKLSKEWS